MVLAVELFQLLLQKTDQDFARACTVFAGHLECVETLLNAGASVQLTCEGSPPLHIAVCTASCLLLQAVSITAVQKLLEKGADPFRRWKLL